MHSNVFVYVFLLGLSLGVGPCVASCGPLLVSYVCATDKSVPKAVWAYILFSCAKTVVYVVLGIAASIIGQRILESIDSPWHRYIGIIAGLFVVLTGVLLLMGFKSNNAACQRLHNFFIAKDSKTIFLFGLFIGILPCAPLFTGLSYIGLVSHTWFDGVLYALVFSLGTVLSPLLIIAAGAGLVNRLADRREGMRKLIRVLSGSIIVLLGVFLIIQGAGYA